MAIKSTPMPTNIDLSMTERTKFTINNDPNRVVYLNLSDMGLATRLNTLYPKLVEVVERVSKEIASDEDEDGLEVMAKVIKEGDLDIRAIINELFDADVSSACAPEGTMLDLFDGSFRFELIIEAVAKLYSVSVDNEVKALKKKVSKYITKYHK